MTAREIEAIADHAVGGSPNIEVNALVARVKDLEHRVKVLSEALEYVLPFLPNEAQMLDDAALNDGRATSFGLAGVKARAALNAAKE